MNEDEFYMNKALRLASEASERGEVPVGAIIIKGNESSVREGIKPNSLMMSQPTPK